MNHIHPYQNELSDILRKQRITPLFQPIVHLASERAIGYESLSRGPQQSPLHTAGSLFEAAEQCQRLPELEKICYTRRRQLGQASGSIHSFLST
ncbi:hypothetical protein VCSRO63_1288 [Vibrio cholerae]|nr:hypothetical protein VCSRO63_1288 [Vibrio cholerae]